MSICARVLLICIALTFCLVTGYSCSREQTGLGSKLYFHISVPKLEECRTCRSVVFKDILGREKVAHISETPDLVVPSSEIIESEVVYDENGVSTFSVILNETAIINLNQLLVSIVGKDDNIIIRANDETIASYRPQELNSSNGIIVFRVREKSRAKLIADMLDAQVHETSASRERSIAACKAAVGDDDRLIEECEQLYRLDIEAESRSLDRAEELLRMSNGDQHEIDQALGVK